MVGNHSLRGIARDAAVLHGLPVLSTPPLPELTTRSDTTIGRRQQAHVRSARLTTQDETTSFGAPCSTVARTVVDLARLDRRGGLVAADAALHAGLLDVSALGYRVEQVTWDDVRRHWASAQIRLWRELHRSFPS